MTTTLRRRGFAAKLAGGYNDLPAWIRKRVDSEHPEFAEAPREFTAPNATSWTTFKKLLASDAR